MSSIVKANISLSKKDLDKTRLLTLASRNVVFYHKAAAGELIINLFSLNLPSAEMPTVVQVTADEISGARLLINKKNLSLVSSTKGQLIQGLDYVVVDSNTLYLTGPYESVGTEVDEIFVGTINSAPMSDIVVASAKTVVRSYTLAIGQTTLNLAHEFQVNAFSSENIGIIKVFADGILLERNSGNSSVTLDRDYYEVDSGNGFGTSIVFNVAPVGSAKNIIVDFGVMSITDNNAIGTIESLAGSVRKLADDLAPLAGTSVNDYLDANPSEVERRAFGDMVLDHEVNKADLNGNASETFSVANGTINAHAVNLSQLNTKAALAGSSSQTFNVAAATTSTHAVRLSQFGSSLAANGYQVLPSGLIMQWGTIGSLSDNSSYAVSFATTFTSAVYSIQVTLGITPNPGGSASNDIGYVDGSVTTSGFTLWYNDDGAASGTSRECYWFAVGR